ncbi:MAG: T9SS type A sorting domain-containing protein [Flavitalea sp.]
MKNPILLILILCTGISSSAQRVTGIYTDYNGYWHSRSTAINPVKPQNHHDLLAFTYGPTTYSTGVNNSVLTSNGISFSPQRYRALPVKTLPTTGSSSYFVGLGQMFDGINNGVNNSPSQPFQGNPVSGSVLASFLTDGKKGLNIGTGLTNIPAGTVIEYSLSSNGINPAYINDGIPDIVFVQIASPSSLGDRMKFVNSGGATVGNEFVFDLSNNTNFPTVANWIADFYNPNSTQNASGFINTERSISVLAIDLSALGITPGNSNSVRKLVYITSGQSDPAFIAYNEPAMSFPAGLTVSSQPLIYQPSAPLASPIIIQLRDASNNAILESNVLVQVTVESGNGTLLGTLSALTDANGVASFNNLRITGNGNHVLRFASDGIDFTVSQPIVETTILPMRWKEFSATKKEGSTLLNWSTEDESGYREFIIQRSEDGINFSGIDKVEAKKGRINQYQWADHKSISQRTYYRLAAVDAAGKLNYSRIVSTGKDDQNFRVYPNPTVNGRFTINLSEQKNVKIYSSAGVLIFQKKLPAGSNQVDVSRFGKGYYLVDVEGKNGIVVY